MLLHHNVVNQKYTVLQANACIGLDSTILNPLIQFSSSYSQMLTQSSQKGTHSSFIHLVLSILSISGSPFEFDQESSYELSFPAYMSHQAPKTLQLSHGILILIRMSYNFEPWFKVAVSDTDSEGPEAHRSSISARYKMISKIRYLKYYKNYWKK